MLTELKAYSSLQSASTLLLETNGREETDLIQIRGITGLEPVDASVNVSPYGSVDGESHTGSTVLSRNIVLTLRPNPDWDTWTYEALRRLLYSYFMPKRSIRLIFYSDDMDPVEISGIVESIEANLFSSDPELVVSIICPDPYFVALNPTVVTGQSIREGGALSVFNYDGNIETGVHVKVTWVSGDLPSYIGIQVGSPIISDIHVVSENLDEDYFELNSVSMQKYIRRVNISTGIITNLLSKASFETGLGWPLLYSGDVNFAVVTDVGVQNWQLTYYEKFGGL